MVSAIKQAAVVLSLSTCATLCKGDVQTYNETEAVKYLQFSRAAFCQPDRLRNWDCGEMCDDVKIVPDTLHYVGPGKRWGVVAIVARLPNAHRERRCVVAFRGSVTRQNWEADGYFSMSAWPSAKSNVTAQCDGCRLHTGFTFAYEELREGILEALGKENCGDITVTGHSLGAAVASIHTYELRAGATGVNVTRVEAYTYGEPRMGNQAYVDAFQTAASRRGDTLPALWRIVHFCDPVPRLPPLGLPFSEYVHQPHEVWYVDEQSSSYRVADDAMGEDPLGADQYSLGWCAAVGTFDHLTYLNKTVAHRHLPKECVTPRSPEGEDVISSAAAAQEHPFVI
eukprot:TRINITY_DN31480_c0_g1_i1.p1 TRINITY_DN31480_c0_g1~~TRINITY_DN31480_c0_g1_i1.p1  ORF type:complete len:340 (-),score=45.44 TRINITY_DN31480_c0_g1_i1:227-1246(-)